VADALSKDLDLFVGYFGANKLSLNIDKSKLIYFKSKNRKLNILPHLVINGVPLTVSTEVTYLGVILDSGLTWNLIFRAFVTKWQELVEFKESYSFFQ
jgi:hypothetical protein